MVTALTNLSFWVMWTT